MDIVYGSLGGQDSYCESEFQCYYHISVTSFQQYTHTDVMLGTRCRNMSDGNEDTDVAQGSERAKLIYKQEVSYRSVQWAFGWFRFTLRLFRVRMTKR